MSMTTNYDSIAQPWSQKRESRDYVPKRANDPWHYAAHPFNWELVYVDKQGAKGRPKKTPLLLPDLRRISYVPGVNGARAGDISIANINLQKKGWIVLDPNKYNYLKVYPAMGGNYHTSQFSTIDRLAGRAIERFNQLDYNQFRIELMKSAALELPHSEIIRKIEIDKKEAINRIFRNQHLPDVKVKLDRLQKELEDFQIAAANLAKLGIKVYE